MDEILTARRRAQPTKPSIVNYFFSLLLSSSNKIPCLWNLIIHIFAELQVLALLLEYVFEYFESSDQDTITAGIGNMTSVFSLGFTYDFSGENHFTNVITGLIGFYSLLVLLILMIMGALYALKTPPWKPLSRIWRWICTLHASCFFLFIQNFTLAFIKTIAEEKTSSAFFNSKMSRDLAVVLVTIHITINCGMGIISSKFVYDPIKDQGDIMAKRSTTFGFLGFLYLLTMTLCEFLLRNTPEWRKWTCNIIGVLLLTSRSYKYITEIPFYDYRVFKLFYTMALVQIAQLILNIFWALIGIERTISTSMVIYSLLPVGIFAVRIGYNHLECVIREYAIKETRTLRSENEFFIKIFAWEKILKENRLSLFMLNQRRCHEYNVIFQHMVMNHAEDCQAKDCGCKLILSERTLELGLLKNEDIKRFDVQKLYYELIKSLYQGGIQFIEKNSLIKLHFANFLIDSDEDNIVKTIYLLNCEECGSSVKRSEMEIFLFLIQDKIEKKIENTTAASHFHVKDFVDYNIQKNILRKKIAEYTKHYINFWETYNHPNPLVTALLKQNIFLSHQAEKLQLIWEYLTLHYSKFCSKDYLLYALYMQIIRNAPFTAEKLFERHNSLYMSRLKRLGVEETNGNAQPVFANDQEDILLCVSLNQENTGRIVFTCQNVKILGYTVEELKNSSIGILMSPFFAKKYSKFLNDEMAQNKLSEHLHKEIPIYVRASQGHIQQASLYLTLFPYTHGGFYCLARIRLKTTFVDQYLFMLPNGRIETGTRDLGEKFNLDFSQNVASISDICLLSHKLFNYIYNVPEESEDDMPPAPTSRASIFPETSAKGFSNHLINTQKELQLPPNNNGSRSMLPSKQPSKPSIFQQSSNNTLKYQKEMVITTEKIPTAAPSYRIAENSNEGIRLRFLKMNQGSPGSKRSHKNQSQQLIYQVKVTTFSFEDQVLYILKLEDVIKENNKITSKDDQGVSARRGVGQSVPSLKAALTEESYMVAADEGVLITSPDQPKITSRLNLEAPHTLLTQERLLSSESERVFEIEHTKKEMYEDNLRRDRRKMASNIQLLSEGESSVTKSSARELFLLSKMEKAIHQKRTSVSYAVVKTAIVTIVLVSIALFLFYQIDGNVKFNHLINNVEILEKSLDILYYVGESTRTAVTVKLINLGFIPRNRHGAGKFDLSLLSNFRDIAPNLAQANNEMRNSMFYFKEEQRKQFYELIPVYYPDNITLNSYHNAFDIHSQLVSSGLRLYADLPATPAPDNPDLNFIINNTLLNSLLTHDMKVFSLLQEEDARIVNEMAEFVLILLSILIFTGVIVIMVTIKNEVNFIKKKVLFFDHFFRINEVYIRKTINKAGRFYEALKDNNYNEEDVLYEVQSYSQNKSKTWATSHRANEQDHSQLATKKRKANFRAINKESWIGVLTLVGFILWFWVAYAILYAEFMHQKDSIQVYKLQIINTGNFLFCTNRGLIYLYIYLGGLGDVKILGKSAGEVWSENLKNAIAMTNYFTELMNSQYDEKYEKSIKKLLNGNLCDLGLIFNPMACYRDGKGATQQGLIGVNNYEFSVMSTLKSKYDTSNKTIEAMKEVYFDSSYAEIERLYFSVMGPSIRELRSVFQELFVMKVERFRDIIFTLNKVWLVSFLVLAVIYWKFGLKKMEREKVYFRSILKVIPLNILLSHKYLHSEMMKYSKI